MDQAENLRNVIKLQNQRFIKNARVITVTSGKGGVGKSNTAINIAANFAEMGKRVIIFDADFGLANIEVMFGTVPAHNLSDVLYSGMQIKDIITKGPRGIGFVSGGSGVTTLNNLTPSQLNRIYQNLSQLDDLCDILIIDTGAGVSKQVMDFVQTSREVLVVATPEPSSITDTYALLKTYYKNIALSPQNAKVYLIANKVSSEIEGRVLYDKVESVVGKFLNGHIEYLGMIPNDVMLEKCVRNQKVVSLHAPTAKSAKAFSEIAKKLLAEEQVKVQAQGITRFFNSFFKAK